MPRPRSRALALALSLLPGAGHLYWGREVRGLAIFTLFAVAGFALLNAVFVYLGPGRGGLLIAAWIVLVATVAASWADILRRTGPRRVAREEEARMLDLREGMVAYVRGGLEEARARFESCVRADPVDVEALFRLGSVLARSGLAREARSRLRAARTWDHAGKWRWELDEELSRLGPEASRRLDASPPGTVRVADSKASV